MLKAAPPALFCGVRAHCSRKRQRPNSGDALPARESADAPPAPQNASSFDAPQACRSSGTFLVLALSEGHAKRRAHSLLGRPRVSASEGLERIAAPHGTPRRTRTA